MHAKYLKISKLTQDLVGKSVVYRKEWDDEANRNGWRGKIRAVNTTRLTIEWTHTPLDKNNSVKVQSYDCSAVINKGKDVGYCYENYIHVLDKSEQENSKAFKCHTFKEYFEGFTVEFVWYEDDECEYSITIQYDPGNDEADRMLMNVDSCEAQLMTAQDLLKISAFMQDLAAKIASHDEWQIRDGDLYLINATKY